MSVAMLASPCPPCEGKRRLPEKGRCGDGCYHSVTECSRPRKTVRGRGEAAPRDQRSAWSNLLVAAAHGCRPAGQLERLPGIDDANALFGVFDSQDGYVAVQVIADIEVLAVGAPHEALGEAAHFDFVEPGHLLAVDLEDDHAPVAIVVPGIPRPFAATQQDGGREVTFRADGQAFRSIAHHHAVDDTRWRRFE